MKGQLVLRADKDFFIDDVKALFVDMAGSKAPYFVTEIRESGPGFIVGLEEITQVEAARPLVGKNVFISAELVDEQEADFDWLGYELLDKSRGSLGKITGVSDNGQQVLITVTYMNREVILPLVEAFIESVDEEKRILYFNAPEGLIDVYLENPE